MNDLIVNPEYKFTTELEYPEGLRVTVTVVAPAMTVDHRLSSDLAELTQMGASHTAKRIAETIKNNRERCPF